MPGGSGRSLSRALPSRNLLFRRFWFSAGAWVERHEVLFCGLFTLLVAVFPVGRAFFRIEINYNEGWNVLNAMKVAGHVPLYPERFGWTSVNYPMLSFAVIAQLHRVTHDWLFTGRVLSLLSLLCCCVLVGLVVRSLDGSRRAAWLAGLFCLALYATDADEYFGMDDPQMFAHVFFLAGLLLYVRRRTDPVALAAAALLFVTGGTIKHNPIDVPIAVMLDLCLISWGRAVWFGGWLAALAGASVWLNVRYGGPFFISQMLAPREYSVGKMAELVLRALGPVLLPFCASVWMAFRLRGDRKRRIAALLLGCSVLLGGYFSGGRGVAVNAMFSALFAMAILTGLFFDRVERRAVDRLVVPARAGEERAPRLQEGKTALVPDLLRHHHGMRLVPVLFFAWLIIPLLVSGNWNPVRRFRETARERREFEAEVALLRERPGQALCESLLRCAFAGKPYEYDPFNATRLIGLGRLDAGVIVERIRRHEYGAIQLDGPLEEEAGSERFAAPILAAIGASYQSVLQDEVTVVYVPKD